MWAKDQGRIVLYLEAITVHCKDRCEDGPAIRTGCAHDPFASKVCRIQVLPDSRDVLQSRHIPTMLAAVSPCWQVRGQDPDYGLDGLPGCHSMIEPKQAHQSVCE